MSSRSVWCDSGSLRENCDPQEGLEQEATLCEKKEPHQWRLSGPALLLCHIRLHSTVGSVVAGRLVGRDSFSFSSMESSSPSRMAPCRLNSALIEVNIDGQRRSVVSSNGSNSRSERKR